VRCGGARRRGGFTLLPVACCLLGRCLLVKYASGVQRWHRLDDEEARSSRSQKGKITVLSLDGGRTSAKVRCSPAAASRALTPPQVVSGEEPREEQDGMDRDDVLGALGGVWSGFPRVPKNGPSPMLVPDSDELLALWYLYDVSFRSPRVELYLCFATPVLAESALSAALAGASAAPGPLATTHPVFSRPGGWRPQTCLR
jgi:hypothetical protein